MDEEVRIFLLEGYENLDQVESDLVSLESAPQDGELIHSIFRAVHTIKGNSGFLAFSNLEKLCHSGEALLDKVRNGERSFSPEMATALLALVDDCRKIFEAIENEGADSDIDVSDSLAKIQALS